MSLKHVRLLLQHNHYDIEIPSHELEVLEDILHKTLLAASEEEHQNLVCDLGNANYSFKFKARHLTGWVVKDTPFDAKVA